jgi:transposase
MQDMATQTREPDPETPEKAKRRNFSAAYKRKILGQLDRAGPGEIGAILRREGLYSSHITKWKRQLEEGTLAALKAKKRGPKPKKDPEQKEIERLRRRVAQLEHKLETAELIIDVQKKVSQLLGIPLATIETSDES